MSAKNPMMDRCGALNRAGNPCKLPAGHGTSHVGTGRCRRHGGASPQAELSGQVILARRQAAVMGTPLSIEPHEAILECIRIAAGEVAYCSERIADLDAPNAIAHQVMTLKRPMREQGGAEDPDTLVEETRVDAPTLHVWIIARRAAMDRLVTYSATALKAGVEERRVRVAEQVGGQLAEAFRRFVLTMGHDPAEPKVREAMRASLTLIAGGQQAA